MLDENDHQPYDNGYDPDQYFSGSFSDFFGSLTSLTTLTLNIAKNLVTTDLSASQFMQTGQDPFFDASRDVLFLLYTNRNSGGVYVSMSNIASTTYDSANPIRFIIHGFLEGPRDEICTKITRAYLTKGDFNVVSQKLLLLTLILKIIFIRSLSIGLMALTIQII